MNKIHYNTSALEDAMTNLKYHQDSNTLNEIKLELNKFFKDSTCKEIIYTKNTDKLFFGMSVIADIPADLATKIMVTNDKVRISGYRLEIDSKLLSPILALSGKELTAIVLHEVGHLVNDSQPVETLRNSVARYLATTNTDMIISDSQYYKEILAFAIKDSLKKITSIFSKNLQQEYIADEFVVSCGYGPELESALNKIVKSSIKINSNVDNKFIVMQYTLRLYRDIKYKRISAIRAFNKSKASSPSTLEIREINGVIRALNQIDNDSIIGESVKNAFKNFKYNSMRSYEDDLYEYNIRVKNVDEEDEALLILGEINSKIAIIDDYIQTERLSSAEKDRWYTILAKYRHIRDYLANKQTYTSKAYELWVKTPIITTRHA